MDREIERKLFKQAQEIAIKKYEEEWGKDAWYEVDKYEREDLVWYEFEQLKKENKEMAQMRDAYGRFISNKGNNATTNTNNNNKENGIMNNTKMNAKEERMNKLAQAGISTENFFDLSLRLPLGYEVKLVVNGKEMTIGNKDNTSENVNFVTMSQDQIDRYNNAINEMPLDILDDLEDDEIAQNIIENGYVKNSKLFRRWIFAHTMRMLNYQSWRDPSRKGWEACMKDCYDYNYQFTMMLEEIRVIDILQKEDKEAFEERIHFFNGDVVIATLKDYERRLRKYIETKRKERKRFYRNQEYCKLSRYGNVFVKDLYVKVYNPIARQIDLIKDAVQSENYTRIYKELKIFMDCFYNKLPHDTTKCAVWKDAFKGAGAFYSLQNAIRFHNVVLKGYCDKYDSERRLYELLNGEYKNEAWRFHQLLVETIDYNNFDLKKSIAQGHAAPNTYSYATNRYAKHYN